MASDAIYNVTRGKAKPWKHTLIGLGLASLTGSKLTMQILNRLGHCINYSEIKGLETEFAYSVANDQQDTPDGIRLDPSLATGCVWDNNDAKVETLNGKETLHATVGHTYQNMTIGDRPTGKNPPGLREGRNRRTFVGNEREIPPFRKPLKRARFVSPIASSSGASKTSLQAISTSVESCESSSTSCRASEARAESTVTYGPSHEVLHDTVSQSTVESAAYSSLSSTSSQSLTETTEKSKIPCTTSHSAGESTVHLGLFRATSIKLPNEMIVKHGESCSVSLSSSIAPQTQGDSSVVRDETSMGDLSSSKWSGTRGEVHAGPLSLVGCVYRIFLN